MSEAQRRLMREMNTLQDESPAGISGAPREDNIMLWEAVIMGPNDTVWEGGIFRLTLQFPDEYPNKPPTVMFTSPMFHPNVYDDGNICLNILEEDWSPIYKVSSILTSIQSLLDDPNTDSPANPMAALLFDCDKTQYDSRVREIVANSWAQAD